MTAPRDRPRSHRPARAHSHQQAKTQLHRRGSKSHRQSEDRLSRT
jgi:hypothetical protein